MISTDQFTNFNRTPAELEELLLFSIAVAGKRADSTARSLERFLDKHQLVPEWTPFETVRSLYSSEWYELENAIDIYNERNRGFGLGQPTRLAKAFYHVTNGLNPATCTLDQLMAVPGIGPKTARMFLLHTRKGEQLAVLDTHILKYLRDIGIDAPTQTPSNPKQYAIFERIVLDEAEKHGADPATFDLLVWRAYARGAAELSGDRYTFDNPYCNDGEYLYVPVHFTTPSFGTYSFVARCITDDAGIYVTQWYYWNGRYSWHTGHVNPTSILYGALGARQLIDDIKEYIRRWQSGA